MVSLKMMSSLVSVVAFLGAAGALPSGLLERRAVPAGFQILSLTTVGSNSISVINSAKSAATVVFSELFAESVSGPAVANDVVTVSVKIPAGFKAAATGSRHSGYSEITAGNSGTSKVTYTFAGSAASFSDTKTIASSAGTDYTHEPFNSASTVWSVCGGTTTLTVGLQATVTGQGFVTVDSLDLDFGQFVWSAC